MHPFEFIRTLTCSPANPPRHLDLGVRIIARVIFCGLLLAALGFWFPAIGDFLLPRFGSIGLVMGMSTLYPLYQWAKVPTRLNLFMAAGMIALIGLCNGYLLLRVGTVDVVENIYHDRIHSSWMWSVASYLAASTYMGVVAYRMPKDSMQSA